VKIANPLSQKGSGFFISLFAYDCYHQLSGTTTITIFAEVDTLPCAEIQVSIGNRNSDADTAQRGLGVSWHIISTFQEFITSVIVRLSKNVPLSIFFI